MSSRDAIAAKLAGFALPIEPEEAKPPIYSIFSGLPRSPASTGNYAPYPGFHESPNVEDRTGALGSSRRLLAGRMGIDQELGKDGSMFFDVEKPTQNPLSSAAGLDQVIAMEQAADQARRDATNRDMAELFKKLPPLTDDERAMPPLTDEELQNMGLPMERQ